jgi:WD40 repeat protein
VSVSFSLDGKRIVTASFDRTAKVWDADTGQELLTLKGHTDPVLSVTFSPDGTRIVTGGWDTTVKVWDAAKGQELLTLKGHTNRVASVAFRLDGKRLVTGSLDTTAKVWDADNGQETLVLKGHTDPVVSTAFSPDGKRAFAWDMQNKVLAWSIADGKPIDPVDPPPVTPPGSARSPDGFLRAEPQGNTIRITDTRHPRNDNSWPLPDVAERKRYHTAQAALAEKEKQWFAVAFHVGRLLLDAPDDAGLKQRCEEALRRHAATVPVGPPVIEKAQ